jgi:hypothetical protein
MNTSPNRVIEPFSLWKDTLEEIKGVARQFSHLTGLSVYLKEAAFIDDDVMVASYSVRPKPLKWKGSNGWNRVSVKIKNDGTFMVSMDDDSLVGFGPGKDWFPVKRSMEVMERTQERIKKSETDES